jgi:hypothetical protein
MAAAQGGANLYRVRSAETQGAVQGVAVREAVMNAPQFNGDPSDDGEFDEKPLEADDLWDDPEPPDFDRDERISEQQLSAEDFADHMADWQRNLK